MLYRCTIDEIAINNNDKSLFRNKTNSKSNDANEIKKNSITITNGEQLITQTDKSVIKHINSKSKAPSDVLLRFYGPANSDTDTQVEVFRKLARVNLGPKLYAEFEGGRLEEYLPSRTLTWHDMIDDNVSSVIAKKLASIHKLNLVSCLGKTENWLLDQYQEYHDFLMEIRKDLPEFKNCSESKKKMALEIIDTDYVTEIDYLSKLFKKSTAPLVFSHNDLHHNNIIVLDDSFDINQRIRSLSQLSNNYNNNNNDNSNYNNINQNKSSINKNIKDDNETDMNGKVDPNFGHENYESGHHYDKTDIMSLSKRIVLIDFEYCSYNYRTFDVANHLNEWCFDYAAEEYPHFKYSIDHFPDEEKQRQFLKNYAQQMISIGGLDKDSQSYENEIVHSDKSDDDNIAENISIDEQNNLNSTIEMLLDEMQPFLMASNLLWALWSIKSACTSKINFGYWVSWPYHSKVHLT